MSLSLDPMPSPSVTMALALKLSTSRLEIVELSASIVPVTVPVIVPDMFPVTCRFSLIVICVESLELNSVPLICIPSTLTLPVPPGLSVMSALDGEIIVDPTKVRSPIPLTLIVNASEAWSSVMVTLFPGFMVSVSTASSATRVLPPPICIVLNACFATPVRLLPLIAGSAPDSWLAFIVPVMLPVTCKFSFMVTWVESEELISVPLIWIPSMSTEPVPPAFNVRSAFEGADIVDPVIARSPVVPPALLST